MNNLNELAIPFNYLKGKAATDRLKQLFNLQKDTELAQCFAVPKGTIATWHQRELTPYELFVRASLATGVSLEALALGTKPLPQANEKNHSQTIQAKQIIGGNLQEINPFYFDSRFIPAEVKASNLCFFITDNGRYLVDCDNKTITQGRYIICIDGVYSLNILQRLPDNKLAVKVAGIAVEMQAQKVDIIGKVISSIAEE